MIFSWFLEMNYESWSIETILTKACLFFTLLLLLEDPFFFFLDGTAEKIVKME